MRTPAPNHLPYAGIRVVEFTHMVMGPTCGMVLGDLGAEVIKVEPPKGDNTRRLLGSGAGFFPLFNRNKKSLVLDLHTPEGKEAVLRLIATADVVSENFKTETMEKLGLDYESLREVNPRLVYCSITGFGQTGPYSSRAGYDFLRLRADAGEIDAELAEWWEDYALGDADEREALLLAAKEQMHRQPPRRVVAPSDNAASGESGADTGDAAMPRKRRRRRRKPGPGPSADRSEPASVETD